MSIVRVGLSETDGFGEGYDAIFGKKKKQAEQAKTDAKSDTTKGDEKPKDESAKK